MENITLFLDVLIAGLSIFVLLKVTGYGGIIGGELSAIGYGIIIIGLAQIFETISLTFFKGVFDADLVHRTLVTVGFFFLAWAFNKMMKKK